MVEVLVEGRRLDVFEGLDFSFNYSVADVRDPNKRSTDYTKTIKCPATKSNDELFGNIWSVNIANPYDSALTNIEANFNPNKKAEAIVVADGTTVMKGVVQLRAINIVKGAYEYDVVFIGKLKNIFSELGDKQLNDVQDDGTPYIDFSDLDHDYTAANITGSWTNTTGYVYPMIDYGIRFEYENNGDRIYDIETWRPAVFIKDIVDRIFTFADFTYTSAFFDSAPFTKLITPFHAEDFTLTDDQIEARQFIAKVDPAQEILANTSLVTIGNTQYQQLRFEYIDQSDPNNLWDATTDEFTAPNLGYYDFTLNSSFLMTRTGVNAAIGVLPVIVRVMRESNSIESIIDEVQLDIDIPDNPNVGQTATTVLNWSSSQELLEAGDTVWVEILIDNVQYAVINGSNDFTIDHVLDSTLSNRVTEETIFEGAEVFMNNFAPETKMSEILLGIFKMFNLYVTIDESNPTNLIIETRDEYYSGGTTRDWTYKLDRKSNIKIKPIALLTGKEYIYTYESDDDYYNKRYEESRGQVYGTRRVDIDNDFLTNTKKVSVPFSATPLVNDGNTNRIIPKIYDEDIEDGAKPVDINMRVLYYDGTKSSAPYWTFRYNDEATSDTKTIYPYAGHLDNPLTPALDLNFGIPKELYYTANGYTGTLQYTNANLFNLYHRQHINEITDKDAKVFTGSFYLDAWDIEKLDFRDQILIDNTYWRLNKVTDYNPMKDGLTKVELFKVLDLVQQPTETFTLGSSGTVGTGVEQEDKAYNARKSLLNFNQYPVGKGSVKGAKNKVSEQANNFKVIGDENFIGGGSKNVTILGNNNEVFAGASNVVIINSDNQKVTTDNVTIIDGHRQWQYVSTDVDYTAKDREVVLADSSKAAPPITITLPTLADNLWVCVKKTDSSGSNVDITAGVSGTIDGSGMHTLTSQYESVELFCDGTNWHIRADK